MQRFVTISQVSSRFFLFIISLIDLFLLFSLFYFFALRWLELLIQQHFRRSLSWNAKFGNNLDLGCIDSVGKASSLLLLLRVFLSEKTAMPALVNYRGASAATWISDSVIGNVLE